MSLRTSAAVTSRKDIMVTANTNSSSSCTAHSRTNHHAQTLMECDAERRLQALDECSDTGYDNVGGPGIQRDANLLCSRTNRRPYGGTNVFNVVDVEELSPWSTTVGRVTSDQPQQVSQSGKTNRPRLNAEVICA